MSVIKGTKDLRKYQIVKGQPDTRQMRCTKCTELAVQIPDGKGGFVYECTGCQARFKMAQI